MIAARQSDYTPAQRAHTRRTLWLLLAYATVLPPLVWTQAHNHVSRDVSVVMAIVASLPLLGIFASWGRYLSDEHDEYHQAITLRRNAIATNATMGAAIVWGFLQAFNVMPLIEVYWIPFLWVVAQGAFGCAPFIFRRRREA